MEVLEFFRFLLEQTQWGALAVAAAVGLVTWFHVKRDDWIQTELKDKMDQLGKDFEQHVGGCREDWEHQKIANEKGKNADEHLLDAIGQVNSRLEGMDKKLDDVRERVARMEGSTNGPRRRS